MHNDINVGIIGYGYASKVFHAPLISSVPGLCLRAIASSAEAKVKADWPQMIVEPTATALLARSDIDLVVIPTPNDTHYPLARQAIEAGKHVILDKPFTTTLTEARSLNDCAARMGRLVSVFHNRRWDSDFLTLRGLVASGELGSIVHFESHFDRFSPEVRTRWRESAVPGGGLWYDLGPHLLDQTLQLLGMPDTIAVDLARQRVGSVMDDYFHALLHYGETRAVLHASVLVPRPGPRFIVHGSRGTYWKYGLDSQEAMLKAGFCPPTPEWGCDPNPGSLVVHSDGDFHTRIVPSIPGAYASYYSEIRDALQGRGPNPVSGAEAARIMYLIELGLKSADAGRALAVSSAFDE